MSIEADLYTALASLVANRVYPEEFPQSVNGAPPVWPAIRYTIVSEVPAVALCGDAGDDCQDTRIQLDLVATTFLAVRALRRQVVTAMQSFSPPAIREGSGSSGKDAETKTHRVIMDYVIYKSSPSASALLPTLVSNSSTFGSHDVA